METKISLHKIYKNTAIAAITAAILCVILVAVYEFRMYPGFSVKKTGVQEVGQDQIKVRDSEIEEEAGQTAALSTDDKDYLLLNAVGADSEYMWIPVPEGISSEDVVIENHYMDRELWVSITGADKAFYDTEVISGDLSGVAYGEKVASGKQLILKFALDNVYEFNTIFEDSVLYVEKVSPRELYDRIVIIDPCGQVPEELMADDSMTPARMCLDIASRLQTLLEDEGIRVYLTSLDERELTDQDRIDLSADIRPDMFVRIETGYDTDTKVYGTSTIYNGTYFIPGFGSVELADLIEESVTTSIGGKADGLKEAGEGDEVIMKATVPAAAVKVGYYTNTQENILLNREDYRSKIAQGIYDAIMSGFEIQDGDK